MAESRLHLALVGAILAHVREDYHAYQLAIIHDLPDVLGAEKPPRIGGFVPDIYAVDAPSTITILGEAKTAADLETDHSRKQLAAFLSFLALQHHGVLVLGVPWQAQAAARNLIARLKRQFNCASVPAIVISNL
jgi:hypothetical protein